MKEKTTESNDFLIPWSVWDRGEVEGGEGE